MNTSIPPTYTSRPQIPSKNLTKIMPETQSKRNKRNKRTSAEKNSLKKIKEILKIVHRKKGAGSIKNSAVRKLSFSLSLLFVTLRSH
jgi:hypothetical protein